MNFPFRLGATSYIIPADILPNVHYLAGKVQDVELVLFDLDDGQSNLPTRAQIAELHSFATDQDLSFSVHLPLDLRMADDGSSGHASLEKARRVIECTRDLDPYAYVAHLDGRAVLPANTSSADMLRWQDHSVQALELVGEWVGDLQKLALENLEGYPLDFHAAILERIAVSRTVDIGHLWLDGHDPLEYLRAALPRTRVIHIHGISERDHSSLAHIPSAQLASVLAELTRFNYTGILTLEMFSEQDFLTSLQTLDGFCNENRNSKIKIDQGAPC
ncbi:MAG: cobamide remodeling phosphodiesterase CbiR [Chloroflexi bacterium]|nr:cobamide remodeling phosphodiesterase CbiR [Chloroflexota bacterium]